MYVIQDAPDTLEAARQDAEQKYSNHLKTEISLAQHGDGFFDKKYWNDYLSAKYECQDAQNKFYILLHELSK